MQCLHVASHSVSTVHVINVLHNFNVKDKPRVPKLTPIRQPLVRLGTASWEPHVHNLRISVIITVIYALTFQLDI